MLWTFALTAALLGAPADAAVPAPAAVAGAPAPALAPAPARPAAAKRATRRGDRLADRGRISRAMDAYTSALDADPGHGPAARGRALARLALFDEDGALADLDLALAADPTDLELHRLRAPLAHARGRFAHAIDDYTALLADDPTNLRWLSRRGDARARAGDGPGALADAAAILRIDPDNANATVDACVERLVMRDAAAALPHCERAVALAPDSRQAVVFRGLARARTGDTRGAIDDYTTAIAWRADAPHDLFGGHHRDDLPCTCCEARTHLCRAAAYEAAGDEDRALVDLDTTLRRHPDDARAWAARGGLRSRMGDVEGARRDYAEALRINPHHEVARAGLDALGHTP